MKHHGRGIDPGLVIIGWVMWGIVAIAWLNWTLTLGWFILAFTRTNVEAAADLITFLSVPAFLIVAAVSLKRRQWPGMTSLFVVVPAIFIPIVPLILSHRV